MTTAEKLLLLRQQMESHQLDACIIPSTDPHQSEYLAAHWKCREWLTGFTGSAGTLVVLHSEAGLWTDSRYFLQAESQLAGTPVQLKKQQVPHAPEHVEWLCAALPPGSCVGIDGSLFSVSQIRHLERQFGTHGIALNWETDLITPIWLDRPGLPADPVFEHDVFYAGIERKEKIRQIRDALRLPHASFLLTGLDEIAWTLNLRGNDVECNPLFFSFLFIQPNSSVLYLQESKLTADLRKTLENDGIAIRPYEAIGSDLSALPSQTSVCLDPGSTSMRLFSLLRHTQTYEISNPVRDLKAVKNPTEIFHIRNAMRKDGVALLRLFRWLEDRLNKKEFVSEYQLAMQLAAFRSLQEGYRGESFPAIVGYKSNGAIIHYRPEESASAAILPEGILLLDSGGQYLDGTTDITRTIALSPPDEIQKDHFTLVLKGHIALATACFPFGTVGMQLDTLARLPLWKHGLNYGHGTGHGVGFFLSVHEAPQGFATNPTTSRGTTAFLPGMLTSNEPGYYVPGAYGIRTENLVLCIPAHVNDAGDFLRFESVSLFPIDRQLIRSEWLTPEEKTWLNDYHQKVFDDLAPLVDDEERDWLYARCLPL